MVALMALNLIFFLIASFAVYRSGRPGALGCLYVFLVAATSIGVCALSVSWSFGADFVGDLARAWWPPQQGDPMGTAQLVAYLITAAIMGNLVSLFLVACLGIGMAARRQAG